MSERLSEAKGEECDKVTHKRGVRKATKPYGVPRKSRCQIEDRRYSDCWWTKNGGVGTMVKWMLQGQSFVTHRH